MLKSQFHNVASASIVMCDQQCINSCFKLKCLLKMSVKSFYELAKTIRTKTRDPPKFMNAVFWVNCARLFKICTIIFQVLRIRAPTTGRWTPIAVHSINHTSHHACLKHWTYTLQCLNHRNMENIHRTGAKRFSVAVPEKGNLLRHLHVGVEQGCSAYGHGDWHIQL